MNSYRTAQALLLLTALIIGVSTPVFNGLSVLALLLVGSVVIIEKRRFARPASPIKAKAAKDTEEFAA